MSRPVPQCGAARPTTFENCHHRREEIMFRDIACGLSLLVAAALPASTAAQAQAFPNRQITIVVGVAPGGITDTTTRIYADVIARSVGQNIVIENRPVAGGAVAAATVQNATPDGYTLLSVVGSQFASLPAMGPTPYDPVKGFAPVSLMFHLPTLLVVPVDSPAKSAAELLAYGRSKPGGLLMGSPGVGTPGHLMAAKIALGTGTPIRYAHYRGGSPVMADLITGRLDFSFASYPSAGTHLGKTLRALAVDAEARLPALPDVPTLVEVGLGAYRVGDWCGVLTTAGTPAAAVEKLSREFGAASRSPELIKKLTDNGVIAASSTPQQMSKLVTDEVKNMEVLINAIGLKIK
jgi:tripartite-type tricarboxylate transporter receptor subunit TctC